MSRNKNSLSNLLSVNVNHIEEYQFIFDWQKTETKNEKIPIRIRRR